MMKMNFRKINWLLLIAFAATILFSSSVSAESAKISTESIKSERAEALNTKKEMAAEKKEEALANRQAKFCDRVSDLVSKLTARFSERKEKIQTRAQNRFSQWEENQSERDAKLADFRVKRDAIIEEHFEKLEARAQTDKQKEAVAEFKKTVLAAVETRRDAIDVAIQAFRDGMKDIQDSRKNNLESEAGTYATAVQTALEKAQSDCENGATPSEVREALHAALESGKDKFENNKEELKDIKSQIETLIETRKTAIKKAIDDFKADMETARAELKENFPADKLESEE